MENKNKVLLHTCCGPCLTHVYDVLSQNYNVCLFYYNPNITPEREYIKRLNEVKNFSTINNIQLIEGKYNFADWFKIIKPYRFDGERSYRCFLCYKIRMEETFKKAKEINIEYVTTTLSVSPYKDYNMISEIGKELENKYSIKFLNINFRKNDGYKKSIELSKKYNMYRQNYCGCIYSKVERDKNSLWYKKNIEKIKNKKIR